MVDGLPLSRRVIVVTGAGSGIGRALCAGFCADGARVAGFGRRLDALQGTADLCPDMLMVAGDINSEQDVRRLISETQGRFGHIDVLINNAGSNTFGSFADSDFASWAGVVETNLLGTARVTHAVLPLMLEQGSGRIVNLVSRAPEACFSGTSAYAVSKGGVLLLTRVLANEIDADQYPDILINDLVPGETQTDMNRTGQSAEAVYPFVRELVVLPAGGPTGKVFFRGQQYVPWTRSS